MKAFLLAAGEGTRLRPLTDTTPKCLVPIDDKPLLRIWLEALQHAGVNAVLLNTHHLADVVRDYVASEPVPGISVRLFHEPVLLGSGGTVAANRDFVEGEDAFMIVYADNLTNAELRPLLDFHRERDSPFTMALFETAQPTECGIASLDAQGRIVAFEEKPLHPEGNLANAGLYVAGPTVFDHLPEGAYIDFGHDVLPALAGRMYGYQLDGYYCDIGTPERLAAARQAWVDLRQARGI